MVFHSARVRRLLSQVGPNPLQLSVDLIGTRMAIDSVVNTLATFANWTLPSGADKNAVLYAQTVIRMNNQSAGALAGGDQIFPGKYTLSAKRQLKGESTHDNPVN